ALGPRDLRDEQPLDLGDARIAAVFGPSARNADLDVLEMRYQAFGPGRLLARLEPVQRLAPGAPPAVAAEFAERGRDGSLHHHRQIVPGAVGEAARTPAPRVVLAMLAGIPAPVGHVDTAADREPLVYHDDFLMMAATDRMRGVELERDSLARRPAQEIDHHRAARGELQRADTPLEDADFQRFAPARQPRAEVAETRRMLAF